MSDNESESDDLFVNTPHTDAPLGIGMEQSTSAPLENAASTRVVVKLTRKRTHDEMVKSECVLKTTTSPDRCGNCKQKRGEELSAGDQLNWDREEGLLCPVCLDSWTSSGPHRLCSLKCGHLFGLSCVNRWLSNKNRTCPSCNARAKKKDIREIYASKLVAVDTDEVENLKTQCIQLKQEMQDLRTQINRKDAMISYLKKENLKMDGKKGMAQIPHPLTKPLKSSLTGVQQYCFRLNDGGCRVLAFNDAKSNLAIAHEIYNALWPGFGISIYSHNFQTSSPVHRLHKKEVRDMSYNKFNHDLLLSVGFDKDAKVFDCSSQKVIYSWTSDERLWSCCWDAENSMIAYVGGEKGSVYKLNILVEGAAEHLPLTLPCVKPVAVLALASLRSLGCILCCRLLSLTAYCCQLDSPAEEKTYSQMNLVLNGKFAAMSLSDDGVLVLSCRPDAEHTQVRHVCYRLERTDGGIEAVLLQVFLGGDQMSQLSRTCLLREPAGLLFFAFNETNSTLKVIRVDKSQSDSYRLLIAVELLVMDTTKSIPTTDLQLADWSRNQSSYPAFDRVCSGSLCGNARGANLYIHARLKHL